MPEAGAGSRGGGCEPSKMTLRKEVGPSGRAGGILNY